MGNERRRPVRRRERRARLNVRRWRWRHRGRLTRHSRCRNGALLLLDMLDLLLMLLQCLLPICLGKRERTGRILGVDPDIEDASLPGVAVVGRDRLGGVFGFCKEDDSEPSAPPVCWVQGDVGAEDGAALAHEILLLSSPAQEQQCQRLL